MLIDVNTKEIMNLGDAELEIARLLSSYQHRAEAVKSGIDSSFDGDKARWLGGHIDKCIDDTRCVGNQIHNIGATTQTIAKMYDMAEDKVLGVKNDRKSSNNGGQSKIENDAVDGAKELNNLLKLINEGVDSEELELLTAFISFFLSADGCKDDGNLMERICNVLGFTKAGLSMLSALDEEKVSIFLNQISDNLHMGVGFDSSVNGLEFLSNSFKYSGAIVEIMSGLLKDTNDSSTAGELWMNLSDSLPDDIVSFYKKLYLMDKVKANVENYDKLSNIGKIDAKFKTGLTEFTPIAAELSMISYSLGTLFSPRRSDNKYENISAYWIGAGTSGANSFVSTLTGGIVELDPEEMIKNVKENGSFFTDRIREQNVPGIVKVIEATVASPVVAVWSVGETVRGSIYDKSSKIAGLIKLVANGSK